MHRERVDLRRPERHDARDEVGAPVREHLRECPAAALAHDRGRLALERHQALEALLEPRYQDPGAVHVGDDARPARPVARALEPARHHRERAVARQEAGDQEHRPPAAVDHSVAAEERVTQERGRLEADASLPPERRPDAERGEVRTSHADRATLDGTPDGFVWQPRNTWQYIAPSDARRNHSGRAARGRGPAGPGAGEGRAPRSRARRWPERRRHAPAPRRLSGPAGLARGHSGPRARRRGGGPRRRRAPLRGGRPRHGDRGRWRTGRARRRFTSARPCRCPRGWSGRRRAACPRSSRPPTTPSSARPACARASTCSCTAAPAAWARPRSSSGEPRERASPPPSAARSCAPAWRSWAPARSTPRASRTRGRST